MQRETNTELNSRSMYTYIYGELDNNSNDWVAQIIRIIRLAKQTRATVLLIIKGSACKRCCNPSPRIILPPAATMNNDQKMGNSKNSKRRTQAAAAWSRTPRRSTRIGKTIFKTKNLMGTPSRLFRAAARRGITPQIKSSPPLHSQPWPYKCTQAHVATWTQTTTQPVPNTYVTQPNLWIKI